MRRQAEVDDDNPVPGTIESTVNSELARLRRAEGISVEKVRELAPVLQRLPAVDDELLRSPRSDRHSAAYSVVKCGVVVGVANPTLRRILIRTLNLDGLGRRTLAKRSDDLALELHIGGTQYFKARVSEAYAELASYLVATEASPCRESGPLGRFDFVQEAIKQAAATSGDITLTIPKQAILEQLFSFFEDAHFGHEGNEIGQAILSELPEVMRYLKPDIPAEEAVESIVDAVFNRLEFELSSSVGADGLKMEIFRQQMRRRSSVRRVDRNPYRRDEALLFVLRTRSIGNNEEDHPSIIHTYWQVKHLRVVLAAALLAEIEDHNDWGIYFGDPLAVVLSH
jgi:hypothetical protein